MTHDQRDKLDWLIRCRFLPGSAEKRFVRQAHAAPDGHELTEKQAAWLEVIWHRYRAQVSRLKGVE